MDKDKVAGAEKVKEQAKKRGGRGNGRGKGGESNGGLEAVAGPSSRTLEGETELERKTKPKTKRVPAKLKPAVKKKLAARKRSRQLSWSLLPDAPLRKQRKKSSPERVECRLSVGTPPTPPAPKLQPLQTRKKQSPTKKIGTGTKKDKTPPAHAGVKENEIVNSGFDTVNTEANLQRWTEPAESDDEVEVVEDIQTDLTFQHQLAPAHVLDDVDTELCTWLTKDDNDSDKQLANLISTDHLTFDWVQDHKIFRGKRECFIGESGPTFPITDETTPLNVFLKFFDDELIDLLVQQTNKYATRLISSVDLQLHPNSRLNFYVNVDRGEMAKFLAILILQGLLPCPVEKSYWEENGYLTLKYFKQLMPYNRFILIKRLLHFSDVTDSESLPTNEKKLSKIKPVLDILQNRFSSLYLPRQDIVIDESLLKWMGRVSFAQRIATKASRVGIKAYELCESDTGYLWRFLIYTGNITDLTDGPTETNPTNATSKIVHDLVKPLYNRGHTLIMDNFYNSPLLARYLKSNGTDCFGTLRVNREFVPETIKTIQKHEMSEGQLVQSYTEDLSIVVWRDTNVVSLISTYHDCMVGGAEKYGRYKFKPQVVLDYNHAMESVNKKNQLLSAFPIERVRNIVWYKKVFRRLLNITLTNAHIIFQTHFKNCSPHDFRRQVAEGLINISKPSIEPLIVVETVKMANARKPNKLRPILKGNHFICPGPCKMARCEWCKNSRSRYICKQCGVSLCLEICFEEYHTAPR